MYIPLHKHSGVGGGGGGGIGGPTSVANDTHHQQHAAAAPPRLTEHRVTTYLENVLTSCHAARLKVYTFIFNCIVLFLFVAVFGSALLIAHMNKLSPEERRMKFVRDQEYVLSKIRHFETERNSDWFDRPVLN